MPGFGISRLTLALLVTGLLSVGCASAPSETEALAYSDEWFGCSSRFQCVVVQDAWCRSVAVNRRFALTYQDFALQQVKIAGERRPCGAPDEITPVAACIEARCTYPIPIGRRR